MHDTEMKLGLDENWKNRSPKKEGTLARSRLVVEHNFTCRQFLIRNLFTLFRYSLLSHKIHPLGLVID